MYAGGGFTSIGGKPRNRIAALDVVSGQATAWDPSANNYVSALVLSGSTVYVGGEFRSIGGQSRNYIAALDAVTGAATPWDPNANRDVLALVLSGGGLRGRRLHERRRAGAEHARGAGRGERGRDGLERVRTATSTPWR